VRASEPARRNPERSRGSSEEPQELFPIHTGSGSSHDNSPALGPGPIITAFLCSVLCYVLLGRSNTSVRARVYSCRLSLKQSSSSLPKALAQHSVARRRNRHRKSEKDNGITQTNGYVANSQTRQARRQAPELRLPPTHGLL
jgi:hypothetical protein